MRQGVFSAFFAVLGLSGLLWSFPPKSFLEFQSNVDRLLGNRQYSFLTDYFTAYAPLFKGDEKLPELSLELGLRLPKLENRQQVWKSVLGTNGRTANGGGESRLAFEYGLTLFIQNKWDEAGRAFESSRLAESTFYRAECLFQKKEYSKSQAGFEKYLVLGSEDKGGLGGKARLRLAEIAFELGQYKKSLEKLPLASDAGEADLLILKYRIYEKTGPEASRRAALSELKNLAKNSVKAQTFLATLK